MNPLIDTSPEIRILEYGIVGYFYSPQQLEALRDIRMSRMNHDDFIAWLTNNGAMYNNIIGKRNK